MACNVSTLKSLLQARIHKLAKQKHSSNIYMDYSIHIDFKYIFKMLIGFMGWRGREREIGARKHPSKGVRDGKVSQTIDPEIHSRRGRRSQGPDPPTLPDLT